MKTIRKEINITPECMGLISKYLPVDNFATFDIESTGLSANFGTVILSGFVIVKDNRVELVQFFAEDPSQEEALLKKTAELLASLSYVITYNGKFFDMPFLAKRNKKYNIETPRTYNLDLFPMIKYYSPLGKVLPILSQKALEEFAGINDFRTDKIGGAESVELYGQYQNNRSSDVENLILLHNSDDVAQLLRLLGLLRNCDIDRAFSKSGFPVRGGFVSEVSLKSQNVVIKGFSDNPMEYISFPSSENPLLIHAHKNDASFEITLPCEKSDMSLYVDLLPFSGASSEEYDKVKENADCSFETIKKCSGYVNNYLVLKEDSRVNHSDLNALAKFIATNTLKKMEALI